MRLFLAVLLLASTAIGVRAAPVRTTPYDHAMALVFTNTYGDKVEFDSDTMIVGPDNHEGDRGRFERRMIGVAERPPVQLVPPSPAPVTPPRLYFHMMPRASSKGLTLLIASRVTRPLPAPNTLIQRLGLFNPRHFMARVIPDTTRDLTILEPGCFADRSLPWPCGWDMQIACGPLPLTRATFVVVGHPVIGPHGQRGPNGMPVPIKDTGYLRPYDLSSDEVLATARVVGDVILDFNQRLVIPLEAEGVTVTRQATGR